MQLRFKDISHLSADNLMHMLQNISVLPKTLGRKLGNKTGAELVAYAKAIPQNLPFLDLSQNDLDRKTDAELTAFAQALSQNLNSLDLSENNLGSRVDNLIEALSFNIQTVILDDKTIYRDSFIVSQLLSQVSNLKGESNEKRLIFDTISLPVEIDEACLNRIIPIFEQQKTPLADLICGFLLDGQIPNTAEEKYGPLEYKEYMEKRTHDAISFYTKASIDSTIKPLAEFLLWEIKQTCNLPSIQHRLEEYDLLPTYIIDSFNQTNKKQNAVKLHLLNELGLFANSICSSNEKLLMENKTNLGL